MNTIIKTLLLSVTAVAATSCSDWLEMNPSNGLPTDSAIETYKDAEYAMNGVYDGLQGNSTDKAYYAARMFYYGDVRGDDMQARTQGMRTSDCYEMRYTEDDAPEIWQIPYDIIRRANRLMKVINDKKITDAQEGALETLYAEAQCARALAHFDLVRIYGLPYQANNGASFGVPVVTEVLESAVEPARNTVAEVYTQVIKDLTEAINSKALSESKSFGRFNVWAAKSLLSRIYLYKGENDQALALAEDVIKNSPYKLWTTNEYVKGWAENERKEMIFELINYDTSDWGDREGISNLLNEDGYADLIVTQAFSNLLDKDSADIRQQVILPAKIDKNLIKQYGTDRVFINKFPGKNGGDMRVNNLPVLRLSEVYLNAAEAAAKTNQPGKAAGYLNKIVQRANPDATPVSDADATLDRILNERRLELVGEGHRFFDLMRNNKKIVRYTSQTDMGRHYSLITESQQFDNSYFRTILPIPIAEINANGIIAQQQNPGY